MKRSIKMSIPAAAIILLSACGDNKNKEENHEGHSHVNTEQNVPEHSEKQTIKDDMLNAIYAHYTHLTAALANGDVTAAKIAANAIEAGAGEIAGAKNISAAVASIITASDIEKQRTAYSVLSDDLIARIRKSGMASGELYLAFCPMAFNDKGASWISSGKEIKNPYFGEKMMTCGAVKETIN